MCVCVGAGWGGVGGSVQGAPAAAASSGAAQLLLEIPPHAKYVRSARLDPGKVFLFFSF